MNAAVLGASPNVIRRLTVTLLAAQSIASLGMTSAITVGSIAVTELMGTTAFAGVPTTLFLVGSALGAYPTGRLMERYGRRFGLTLGFLIGTLGTATAAFALVGFLPLVLFVGNLLMGLSRGAIDQGRYAAGDLVSQSHRARAIGMVVLGGAVGGIGGAWLIGPASQWAAQLGLDPLVGPYLAAAVLFVIGSVMMFALLRPDPLEIGRHLAREVVDVVADKAPPRTFSEALGSSPIQTAIAAMILGQVVMVTVMVMTPLQMTEHLHHTLDDVAIVIAAHVTGMYLTSPVTGWIADRVGHAKTILIGAIVLIVACVLAPFSTDTLRLAFALFVLGAGWNFCFVAGSSLLTDSLRPNERARIQGANDLLVGLVAATASLISGFAFASVGYQVIAFAGITLAVFLFGITLWKVQRAPALGSA